MKRLAALILSAMLLFSLVACDLSNNTDEKRGGIFQENYIFFSFGFAYVVRLATKCDFCLTVIVI